MNQKMPLQQRIIQSPMRYWWAFVCFFLTVGVFLGLNNKVYFSYIEKEVGVMDLIWPEVLDWLIWAVYSPFIIILAKKYPGPTSNWKDKLRVHIPLGLLLSVTHAVVYSALRLALGVLTQEDNLWSFSQNFMHRLYFLHVPLILYSAIVGFTYATTYYQQFKAEAFRASQIQQKLAQAELMALKKQLHPHFLFNTLNTISSLMHKDLDTADKMIVRLSNLLRASLENTGKQQVTLQQELDVLRLYLEIEEVRFQDRLEVNFEIDPKTLPVLVPNLILQPIVENAIQYGIAPFAKKGIILVSASKHKENIVLEVTDNGKGIASIEAIKEGIGLSNTKMRLAQLYGNKGVLQLKNVDGNKGLQVTILIPLVP